MGEYDLIIEQAILGERSAMERCREMFEIAFRTESPIERVVYLRLQELYYYYGAFNIDITLQCPILKYTADFLVEYNGKKVVIECDGHEFHEKTQEQASKDKRRDREMQMAGYVVFRYTGSDIYKRPSRPLIDLLNYFGVPEWSRDGIPRS